MRKVLRRLRPLIVIYAIALLVALYEVSALSDSDMPPVTGQTQRMQELLRDDREVELLRRLYPNRKDTNYLLGLRALMPARGMPDLQAARRSFERALAADENDEGLLYAYALTLDLIGEDPALVDAAVADWRRRFPLSTRPDPRSSRSDLAAPASGRNGR